MCCPQENQDALTKREKDTASILVRRPMKNVECTRPGGPCMNKRHHDYSSHKAQSTHDCGVIDGDAHSGGEDHGSTTGSFNLSSMDIWGCPVHRRMSNSTLGLCPLDARIKPHQPSVATTKKISRLCQVSPGGQKCAMLRTNGLQENTVGASALCWGVKKATLGK